MHVNTVRISEDFKIEAVETLSTYPSHSIFTIFQQRCNLTESIYLKEDLEYFPIYNYFEGYVSKDFVYRPNFNLLPKHIENKTYSDFYNALMYKGTAYVSSSIKKNGEDITLTFLKGTIVDKFGEVIAIVCFNKKILNHLDNFLNNPNPHNTSIIRDLRNYSLIVDKRVLDKDSNYYSFYNKVYKEFFSNLIEKEKMQLIYTNNVLNFIYNTGCEEYANGQLIMSQEESKEIIKKVRDELRKNQ